MLYRAISAAAVCAFVTATASCQPTSDNPYQSCYREEQDDGIKFQAYIGDRACIKFDRARVIEGVWINEFEGSQFFEGAHNLREAARRHDNVWLTIDEKSETPAGLKRPSGHAHYMRFLGMTAHDMHRACGHGYGHLECSAGLVLVDRVLAAVDLGEIPPPR